MPRNHLVLMAILVALAPSAPARAVPPPNLPLPPCTTDEDGYEVGACPLTDPRVDGSSPGRLSFNSSVMTYVEPQVGACSSWDKNGTGLWSPDPCYREVFETTVVGCAYVDVRSDRFVRTSCPSALFATNVGTQLFSVGRGDNGECASYGDFWVYVYGGPATQADRVWSARGPLAGRCELSYLGPKPDGLYGPTWVELAASIDVVTGVTSSDRGTRRTTRFYVPIDGDMRDLGPVAGFRVLDSAGGKVTFDNLSIHTLDEAMTYRWDFGDGGTSGAGDPEHRYKEPGTYTVKLVARDLSGDEDETTQRITVDFKLVVDLSFGRETPAVDEDVPVTLSVTNPFDEPVHRFSLEGAFGLTMDPDYLELVSGPDPAAPETLGPGERVDFQLVIKARVPGRFQIEGGAQGWLGDRNVRNQDAESLLVPARLAVSLAASVDSETKVGDEVEVIATLTNNEDLEISNIKSDRLEVVPSDMFSMVSGPTTEDGTDPRVAPITLAAGESTTIRWRVKADGKGVATLTAYISGRDPYTEALFYVSADKRVAIESAALEVTDFRMQPGSPVPGDFGNLRGVVTNIGSIDVTDIDFAVTSKPKIEVVASLLEALAADVSPRIPKLEPGETHEFLIPFGMVSDAGGLAAYTVDVTFTGTAVVDGEDAEVSVEKRASGSLDLSEYWTEILSQVKRQLLDFTLDFFEGVNEWGDESTLGGVTVGGGEGVLAALQKMGDGVLKLNDILGEASGDGGQRLTEEGKAIVGAAREYLHTTSPKKMLVDLANLEENLTVGAVGIFADWLYKVDTAQAKGDVRELSKLLSEPATEIAVGFGAEAAGAKIFGKIMSSPVARETMHYLKKAPDEIDELAGDVPWDRVVGRELADLKDMPTGVRITGETVARAGITPDEHAWMIEMAQEHGVAFFVRPRPEEAARFARLGYDDYADSQGLVVLREPKDPFPAMKEAVERGDLEWGGSEIDAIIKRYNKRRAEWDSKDELLAKLNAGDGFEIQRYGKTIKTKVTLDGDGLLRFTHNNQPVYSDIDLLQIARPNGDPIPPELHDLISREAGFGFDSQHGDTFSTSDFPSWETAEKFVKEYGAEHMRGGDPLVIVQPDVTTLGYVDGFELPAGGVEGSGYDLYGQVRATYEGAGTR